MAKEKTDPVVETPAPAAPGPVVQPTPAKAATPVREDRSNVKRPRPNGRWGDTKEKYARVRDEEVKANAGLGGEFRFKNGKRIRG